LACIGPANSILTLEFQEPEHMTFGYLIPITPREMPFNLDVMETKDQTATNPKRVSRFGRVFSRKKV
jgi:hypothetical protein